MGTKRSLIDPISDIKDAKLEVLVTEDDEEEEFRLWKPRRGAPKNVLEENDDFEIEFEGESQKAK